MFPTTRTAQLALALGTLIFAMTIALPAVSFRLTDLGVTVNGAGVELVGDGTHHLASSGAAFHVGGCKFVGQRGVCSHKELTYDRAHGLRFAATVTTRPPSGI
jgi:hypothetical protein